MDTLEIKAFARGLRFVVFDFDGVFTDNRVIVLQDGTEGVRCSRSDGRGLARLRSLGIEMMILSTETNPVVKKRVEKLGLPCISGVDDKIDTFKNEMTRRSVAHAETAFAGNDINDIECLVYAGVGVVAADAWPEAADHVLTRKGGNGAVREFCDRVWRARADSGE